MQNPSKDGLLFWMYLSFLMMIFTTVSFIIFGLDVLYVEVSKQPVPLLKHSDIQKMNLHKLPESHYWLVLSFSFCNLQHKPNKPNKKTTKPKQKPSKPTPGRIKKKTQIEKHQKTNKTTTSPLGNKQCPPHMVPKKPIGGAGASIHVQCPGPGRNKVGAIKQNSLEFFFFFLTKIPFQLVDFLKSDGSF